MSEPEAAGPEHAQGRPPRPGSGPPRPGSGPPLPGSGPPLPRLRLPSAARLRGALGGLRFGRGRGRRAVLAVLALGAAAAGAVVGARTLSSRAPAKPPFPRTAKDFDPALLDKQLAAATERLEADPENLQALVDAGMLHFLKGPPAYRTAINELEEARKLGSVDPRIFYYLGVMYQEEGLLPYAVAEYRRFVRNFPDDRETRLLLGKLLYQTGRYEDAAVQYQSLKTAREAADPVIEENLGLSLLALRRFDEAAKSFEPLLSEPAFAPRAHFYLGQAAFEQGRFEGARGHFAEAAAAGRPGGLAGVEPVALWAAVAANDEKLEDWAGAKEHWEAVLKLDPKSVKARSSRSRVNARLRAAERAAAAARKAAPPKAAMPKAAMPKSRKK